MTERFDAIVIGAGHNGLTCAAMLAKAGREVLVLEARDQVGGSAVTENFADQYSVSSVAHLLYGLQPQVMRELDVKIELASDNMASIALSEDGQHVRLRGDEVQGVNEKDRYALAKFQRRMRRFARLLNRQLLRSPPRLGTRNRDDVLALTGLGLDLRRLGRTDMREFLRVVGMNIYDELEECFESPLLKGLLSLDAVLGTHLGPRSPNTVLTYLYRMAATGGQISIPSGGMGAVSATLASCATNRGVRILTSSVVERIVVENGRAVGVETGDGQRFDSFTIISNVDPRRTILDLVGSRHLETGFTRRIGNIRMRGNAAKLHLALARLPDIKGFDERDYNERLVIAPDANYVERAFNPAKYGQYSPEPVFEICFPSACDASFAPQGGHVLSAVVQYAPHTLQGGWTDAQRAAFEQTALATLARYMPGIEHDVLAIELLTPADIEACFGVSGGHWHHGELTLDQFMFVRPVSSAAQYAMPLEGLFLCGAGAHPGGNVSGAAGYNAARAILRREKSA
ncbi:MAG: NAD(P)/FAD-dependent oxidoreductase [Woeseia sp.]|nr:NAD(P)/FAD-dependent oxidoreductase [Woeseia sp.]MBT8095773.1 NAD(P)/FAD-dependent oxidoreductase [Woeseia sp.]NNE61777.1 NAD(P)/FAD-dependent oxidoreductase [Woeseia sp.]NNL54190.1 NAD(P)/FAD-dependent oxidoreductase [Woeseia sp.]